MTAEPPSPPPAPVRLPRGRRYAVRAMLVTATIVAVAGIFAVWANRQVLNANHWANTSTALLESPAIRNQASNFLVDAVYANVDVNARVASALPPRAKPLAGPAANGLRNLAEQTTEKALGRPRVQEAWRRANRAAAQQFINVAEGNSTALTSSGNAVVLDLGVVLDDVAARLGVPASVTAKIPPSAGQVKIMSGKQVTTLQNAVSALRGLAIVLPALAVALLAGAVYLARGRRRQTLLVAGIDLVIAGLLVLIGRNVAGDSVVNSLVKTEAVKPAAHDAWSIGTHMLRDVAQASIVIGIPVIVAAWLAGPMRPAVAFRRAVAPWLRDRADITYGVVAALLLLVIAWGPIPATRELIPVLLMIGLVVLGVEALRRQTALEFPDATSGSTAAALRVGAGRARGLVASGRGRETGAAVREGDGDAAPRFTRSEEDSLDRLERLSVLREKGVLDDEEFAAEKAELLARDRAASPPPRDDAS